MRITVDGPVALVALFRCPDCHAIAVAQVRLNHMPTDTDLRREFLPVHCRGCAFNWSLPGREARQWLQLDFSEWRAA